jgi:proline iminopeptidase
MRDLYPPIEPYQTGTLPVSDLHTLYFEQVGNPDGNPVVFLHGGPGGGIDPIYRQYFNPDQWRVVLFDQRGCGRSTPHAELRQNTTWDLVNDVETLRIWRLKHGQYLVVVGAARWRWPIAKPILRLAQH